MVFTHFLMNVVNINLSMGNSMYPCLLPSIQKKNVGRLKGIQIIRDLVSNPNWTALLEGLNLKQMVEKFTNAIYEVCSMHIPNWVVKFDDRGPPWMKHEFEYCHQAER